MEQLKADGGDDYDWFAGKKGDDPRYTANETYGFIYKKSKFEKITLCDFLGGFSENGYARAPQLAWFHLKEFEKPLGVIAYHPPADSSKHKSTRGLGFKLLRQYCDAFESQKKGIIVLAFDSNINTTLGQANVLNCDPPLTIEDVFGRRLKDSIFIDAGTSLRRSKIEPRVSFMRGDIESIVTNGENKTNPPRVVTNEEKVKLTSEIDDVAELIERFAFGPHSDQTLNAFDKIVPICLAAQGLKATVTAEAVHSIIQPDVLGEDSLTQLNRARLVSDHQMISATLSITGPRAQVQSDCGSSSSSSHQSTITANPTCDSSFSLSSVSVGTDSDAMLDSAVVIPGPPLVAAADVDAFSTSPSDIVDQADDDAMIDVPGLSPVEGSGVAIDVTPANPSTANASRKRKEGPEPELGD